MLTRSLVFTGFVSVAISAASFAFADAPVGSSAAPPAGATAVSPKEDDFEDRAGRVRWGFSAGIGSNVPQVVFTVGLLGRLGYQFSSRFGAYGTIGCAFGFKSDTGLVIAGSETRGGDLYYCLLGALGEATFGDLFYIGGGPVLANGTANGVITGPGSDGVMEFDRMRADGFKPGLDLRFGLGFGKHLGSSRRGRGGLSLGIDALLLFHPDAYFETTRLDGPNGEAGTRVSSLGLGVTLVPLLTLGYESR